MRNILFGLLFFMSSCSGQQASNNQVQIDTAKLFDPKQEPVDYSSTEMFKNFVLLNQQPYALTIQGKQLQAKSDKELYNKIQIQKTEVIKSKFYVIVDCSFAFAKIIDIIDNLKKLEIDNYKVINFDSYFKAPDPIKFQQPTITNKSLGTIDSSDFVINLDDEVYEVTFQKKKTICRTSKELDQCFTTNKSLIDNAKIIIVGAANTPYEKFKTIIEVLKKHDYLKFQLVTK